MQIIGAKSKLHNYTAWSAFSILLFLLVTPKVRAAAGVDTWSGGGSDALWSDTANWSVVSSNRPPAAGDTPTFGPVVAGAATLTNDLTALTSFLGLTFSSGAPSFVLNGNAITSTGGIVDNSAYLETINLSISMTSPHTFSAPAGGTMVVNGQITGSGGGVTKTGGGFVSLTATNSYTGATAVNAGTLTLDFTASGAPGTNIVSASSALQLGGGTLNVVGQTGSSLQTFASTAVNAGQSVVNDNGNVASPTVVQAAITETPGGTVEFVGPPTINGGGNVAATGTNTTTTLGAGGAGGILAGLGNGRNGAWATVGLYDWASIDNTGGTTNAAPYSIIGGSQVTGFYQTTGITTTGNYDVSGGVNTLGNAGGAQTLRFNTPSSTTITFSATTAQNIQGILVTPNMGAVNAVMTGGGLEFIRNTSAGNSYGVIWQNNTNAYLNFNSIIEGGRQAGQANGLVQAGPGTVVYGAASGNFYELATYLDGGFSVAATNTAFGAAASASAVSLNGGTVVGNATFKMDNSGANLRPFTLLGNGGGFAATAGNTMTVDGVVGSGTGTGPLTIGIPAQAANGNTAGLLPGSGPGTANTTPVMATGTVVLTGANFYYGGTVVDTGTLRINGIFALGGADYGGLTLNGGTLQYAAAFSGNGSGDLTSIGTAGVALAAGGGTIDVNGNSVAYAGTVGNGGSGALTVTSTLTNGVLNFQGAGTWTGGTTVGGGTLSANNTTGSATGSGSVTVASGATLAGGNTARTAGFISGAVTVQSGGTLAPGTGVGTLTLGSLDLASGSFCNFEFNTTPTNDQVVVTTPGGLVIDGGAFYLFTENSSIPWTTAGTYKLVQYSGSLSGAGTSGGSLDSTWTTASGTNPHVANPQVGYLYSFGTSGGYLTLTITPNATSVLGTWSVDANGNWSTPTNWNTNPKVPHAAGDSATFGVGTAQRVVTLDTNETVGGITMSNANSFLIASAGKTLTLDNTGSGVEVNVLAGTANGIQTAVALNDNTAISVSSGATLAVSGTVNNSSSVKTLTLNGPGTLSLSGNNAYGPAAGSVGTAINGSGMLQLGNNNALGAGDVNVNTAGTIQASGSLGVANNFNLATGGAETLDNNGNNVTLTGVISGNGGLVKTNGGTLTLGGVNTFAGGTTVDAGVLNISADSGLGAAPGSPVNNLVLNGGDLLANGTFTVNANRNIGVGPAVGGAGTNALIDVPASLTVTVDGIIGTAGNTGTNSLTVNSGVGNSGTLILAGADTFNGVTVIGNGTLQLANTLALQSSTLSYNTGTLLFDGTISSATLGGLFGSQSLPLLNTGAGPIALTVGGNNSSGTFSGALSGTGSSLTKSGSGTLTLSGNNTYSGSTFVSAGTLSVPVGGFITNTTSASTGSGGTLSISGGSLVAGALSSIGGTSFGGTFALSAGSAAYNSGVNSGSGDGSVFNITGGSFSATTLTLQRTASFTTAPTATAPIAASTTSGFYVNGALANATIGTLNIGTINSSASARLDAGTVNVTNEVVVGHTTNTRWDILQVNGGIFNVLDTVNGIVVGPNNAGSVNNAELFVSGGTLTAGIVNFGLAADTAGGQGFLIITNGSLFVGAGGLVQGNTTGYTTTISLKQGLMGATADWSSTLPMQFSGAAFTIDAADNAAAAHNISLGGVLSGVGGLTKMGAGTLTLSAASTYTGATTVGAGTLALTGSIATSTNIDVNAAGILDVSAQPSGLLTLSSGQTLQGAGKVYGSITSPAGSTVAPGESVAGTLTVTNVATLGGSTVMLLNSSGASSKLVATNTFFGGTLLLSNIGPAYAGGNSFQIFSGGTRSGMFSSLSPTIPGPGMAWNTNALVSTGVLSIISTVANNPTNITISVNGNNLSLSWPSDHLGWILQSQTNNSNVGLLVASNAWFDVPGSSSLTNTSVTMDPSKPTVFYRLRHP